MKGESLDPLTDIERAVRFYYLMKLSYGSRMTSPNFRLYTDQPPRWNQRAFEQHLKEVSERLKGVTIECLYYTDLIQRYDRPWTLFYCDPPYLESEKIYPVSFNKDDHEELAGLLKNIKGRFILSYNDHPDIWRPYEGLQFRQVEGYYSIQRKDHWVSIGELLITNF